jgi:regulator of sirC expression with transglutaminase-like and TPR domain
VMTQLDALAAAGNSSDVSSLADELFACTGGFVGNTTDYGDPRNSYLDDVLARRLGIPISLSVVMMEVGRRRGLRVLGIGMPGHFLVRGADEASLWYDPFHRGRRLDEDGCRMLFRDVRGADAEFDPAYLEAVSTLEIVRRMLANLEHSLMRRDPAAATWALRLRLRLPTLGTAERHHVARVLGSLGAHTEAAAALDALAESLPDTEATRAAREAAALRARGN